MKFNWKLPFPFKRNHVLILKLVLPILLLGIAFRFFFASSGDIPAVLETPLTERTAPPTILESPLTEQNDVPEILETPLSNKTEDLQATIPLESPEVEDQIPRDGKCNLFVGEWIPNPSGPVYNNESCPHIEAHQNCMKNGRPDTEYLYWRWKPRDCELSKFDPQRFLEAMRDKKWALIGDSISRNHVQSLLCMLSTVEVAVHIYHDEGYKSRKWRFPSYNFTVSVIWSPFLAEAAIFEDYNGVSTSEVELHLDKLDKKWIDEFHQQDYMIISSGKWFVKSALYYENNKVLGCHSCPKRNCTELGIDFAYRRSLRSALNFIVASKHKGMIFMRTSTPDHFENGEWSSGGTCDQRAPIKEGEIGLKELTKILRHVELEEFKKAEVKASRNGMNLKLLDLTQLSLLRPDGHPGSYREFQPFAHDKNAKVQKDCLHWCLPGPIDSWNDVIMEMMFNE
ncbi:protein trichome birefringence-like 24 [Cucurbita maxima]|uniref:Protein trichome birefringence-like 24 n=1 Tax=Cucurbita maxima TaxID=3661 RepID=A0A6J1K034_CUCMA|nr:protein trichome birefringence-like 24 [Cucurbita maxima]XP_022995831.1 protein trichome birefringence-like 24 [Cucurbita maxima]XP_022995832.1 protein trichome birefringence-like 24 [Cucurbita maxima]